MDLNLKLNMNQTDRVVRLIVAALLSIMYYLDVIHGILGYIGLALAVIFVATAFVRFCPIYALFGWSTCKRE